MTVVLIFNFKKKKIMIEHYQQSMTGFHSNSTLSAMKYSFYLKKDYKNKENKHQLYLNLSIHGERKRIPINLYVKKKEWDQKKQLVKNTDNAYDFNLILNNIRGRINDIEIQYRLSNDVLTVKKCAELIQRPDLTIDFISFFQHEMQLKTIEENSLKNHKSTLKKINIFRELIFLFYVFFKLFILSFFRNNSNN